MFTTKNRYQLPFHDHTLLFTSTKRQSTSSLSSSLLRTVTFSFLCNNLLSTTTNRIDHSYLKHMHSYNDIMETQ